MSISFILIFFIFFFNKISTFTITLPFQNTCRTLQYALFAQLTMTLFFNLYINTNIKM